MRWLTLIAAWAALLILPDAERAAFPGENGRIAYQASQCGTIGCTGPNLYDVFEDGTGRTQLTKPGGRDAEPAWSADGSKIAFTTDRHEPRAPSDCGARCNWEIYTMNADGTSQTRLTFDSAEDRGPTWSPDGSKIAFTSARSPYGIYVMNADGSDQRLLLAGMRHPAWSPDGTKIAYTGPGGESDQVYATDIWVMDADGTNQRRVTQSGDIEYACGINAFTIDEADYAPNWSPDGTRLVYAEFMNDLCLDGDASDAIEVVNADGTGPERTIHTGYCVSDLPAWSPDGNRIVFSACLIGMQTVNPDGSGARRVPGGSNPDWQPIVNRPPECSGVTADPSVLWPPNRRFRVVQLAGATDPDGDDVTIEIRGVTQDEPVRGGPDALGAADNLVRLQADRDPRSDGRVYQVGFTATDSRGAQCEGTAKVAVPRHRGRAAVDSAPPSYDSFGG